MRLAAVVVTHNSAGHIKGCLASLRPWMGTVISEAVVVDNASVDATCQTVRESGVARLTVNASNRGFAAAVNQGVRATTGDVVLLLNPDTEVFDGLDQLVASLKTPGTGAAGGRLEDAHGKPQTGFQVRRFPTALSLSFEVLGVNRLWPGNPVNRRYRCTGADPGRPALVDQPAGAFLAFRREAWESVGGFDESYFPVWFEDVDFCFRLKQAGWDIRYQPAARALHAGGHSVKSLPWGARQYFWYRSLLRYVARHMGIVGRFLVCSSVGLAAGPRAIAGIAGQRSFQPVIVLIRVVYLASACLFGYALNGPVAEEPAGDRH